MKPITKIIVAIIILITSFGSLFVYLGNGITPIDKSKIFDVIEDYGFSNAIDTSIFTQEPINRTAEKVDRIQFEFNKTDKEPFTLRKNIYCPILNEGEITTYSYYLNRSLVCEWTNNANASCNTAYDKIIIKTECDWGKNPVCSKGITYLNPCQACSYNQKYQEGKC